MLETGLKATLKTISSPVTYEGKPAIYQPGGRHDITVVPRAVPVVEAMAALVIADQLIEWFALGNYLPENHSD